MDATQAEILESMNDLENLTIQDRDKINDVRFRTARTELQCRRADINAKIRREIKIKSGAAKILEATRKKKHKEAIEDELNSTSTNLNKLKEQLDQINCSLETYQDLGTGLPMLPMGLKETSSVNFFTAFSVYIQEHYYDDPDKYENGIEELNLFRERVRVAPRNSDGLADYLKYFNLLNIISNRFYPPERPHSVNYTWFDSITGIPFQQRTVVFEKGSILFNIAAIYSQIATKYSRTDLESLRMAQTDFSLSAGTLQYLKDNFANSPSTDMKRDIVEMLQLLQLAQAQECVYLELTLNDQSNSFQPIDAAGEATAVSRCFERVMNLLAGPLLRYMEDLPYMWTGLVQLKVSYYSGLAHRWLAVFLLRESRGTPTFLSNGDDMEMQDKHRLNDMARERLSQLLLTTPNLTLHQLLDSDNSPPITELAIAFLNEGLKQVDEILRTVNHNPRLQDLRSVIDRLQNIYDSWKAELSTLMAQESAKPVLMGAKNAKSKKGSRSGSHRHPISIVSLPLLRPLTVREVVSQPPRLSSYPMADPFHLLGPIEVFNAKKAWTKPRTVTLETFPDKVYGFGIRGDSPVVVVSVEQDSPAHVAGFRADDLVVSVGAEETRWAKHSRVVDLVRSAGRRDHQVTLSLCSPIQISDPNEGLVNGQFKVNEINPYYSMPIKKQGEGSSKNERGGKWRKRLSGTWFKPRRSASTASKNSIAVSARGP